MVMGHKGFKMSQAMDFNNRYRNCDSELMSALDNEGVVSDQDWDNESTTWTFEDGSYITIGDHLREVS